jgi:type VI secretion system protein ImpC
MAKESLQRKISRVRPPRVHITYDIETGGALEKRELPFVVAVFADLSGMPKSPLQSVSQRKFVEIDRDNFDHVMRSIAPHVAFTVRNLLDDTAPPLPVELSFTSIEGFHPDRVARQLPQLRELLALRLGLSSLRGALIGNDNFSDLLEETVRDPLMPGRVEDPAVIDRLVQAARFPSGEADSGALWLKDFFGQISIGRMPRSNDAEQMTGGGITDLDERLSRQLDEIMHAVPFQRLEASWRGLWYLVQQTETSAGLKIKVFDVGKSELMRDFRAAASLEQSELYRRIYQEEYGSTSGIPLGVLIGDYEFGADLQDIHLLENLSDIAASSNAPFISAAAPSLFHFESFTELASSRDLGKIFSDEAHLKWTAFRKSEDSRYVGLCLPHVLMRLPYGRDNPVEEFDYRESGGGEHHAQYLWGNVAYTFAARLTDAFARHGWCAAIRNVEGGGLVEGLPLDSFITDDGDIATKSPTEIAITDRREAELAALGFIPLCYFKGTDMAAFMQASSVQKPQLYLDDEATANSRLSTQLPYIFAGSRFAHFLKKIARDRSEEAMSNSQLQKVLNQWIAHYVLLDDVASQESRARFPLRDARVEVVNVPGRPGARRAVVFLRPHFQLDDMAVSLRLVVNLPTAATSNALGVS